MCILHCRSETIIPITGSIPSKPSQDWAQSYESSVLSYRSLPVLIYYLGLIDPTLWITVTLKLLSTHLRLHFR